MKRIHSLALLAATGALLVAGPSWLRASETDNRIESSFRNSYVFKTYLKDDSIKAKSENGAVTLTGSVAEESHKSLAQDTVEGVKDLKNDMTIAPAPKQPAAWKREKIDDASITAQVKSSLRAHYSTSALKAKIATTDGVVTVGGTAKNAAQKKLVTKLVNDINGGTSVINNMTIEEAVSQAHAQPSPVRNLRVVANELSR